jgi:signal transduction histidine kinase
MIRSYPGPLFQIVSNLVSNTIIHGLDSSNCGTITIRIALRGGKIHFTYSDQGPGLDDTGRKMIFEPFYTTRREKGGTGLGMHIVYNLVTQTLGGSIECPVNPEGGFLCRIKFPVPAV